MNITQLLHFEMIQLATSRVNKTINAPRFTWIEEKEMLRSEKGYIELENQALDLFKKIGVLIEYQNLKVEIDNSVQQLRDFHSAHKKSKALKLFWKYFIPLSNAAHKAQREDCARLAYLMTLTEIDHQLNLGVGFTPDVSFIKSYNTQRRSPLARSVSSRSRVERYLNQQLTRDAREDYEVRDGILISHYALLMGED